MAQNAHLSNIDPEFAALLEKAPRPPLMTNITTAREVISSFALPSLVARLGPLLPKASEYRVEDRKVPVDGGEITVRTVVPTPAGAKDKKFPLLVWYHGGGWAIGNIDLDDYVLRILSVELQITTVNVDYRLAPEHPFPTGINDSYAATKWAATQIDYLSADLSKGFLVGGESAGGNLSAVVALKARDDPFFVGRQITGQVLLYPALSHPDSIPDKYKGELLSMEQNKDAPVLDVQAMTFFRDQLKPVINDPDFAPINATSHANLPPASIQVCGLDPLRDEGLLYEKILKENGVKTQLRVYPGVPHAFHVFFPALKTSAQFDQDTKEAIKWLLSLSA